eukprot:TRINITY_DN637_c0_g1_i1.p1 TRINITY_DN637_c0_g1~~TRINITY_DN637_c0_g1_i1.p1  ORF type:complete len:951 (-),score=409.30 TRINITY_DN637_c0_g1_i1:178-3030(-)
MKVRTLAISLSSLLTVLALILLADRIAQKVLIEDQSQPYKSPQKEVIECKRVYDRQYVIDEKGRVCKWQDVNFKSGCCPLPEESVTGTQAYSCHSCNYNCCSVYSYCVSCCLNPENEYFSSNPASYKHRFELCVSSCRTSSSSVVNENQWVSEKKHCFPKQIGDKGGNFQPPPKTNPSASLSTVDDSLMEIEKFPSDDADEIEGTLDTMRLGKTTSSSSAIFEEPDTEDYSNALVKTSDNNNNNNNNNDPNKYYGSDVYEDKNDFVVSKLDKISEVQLVQQNMLKSLEKKISLLVEQNQRLEQENKNLVIKLGGGGGGGGGGAGEDEEMMKPKRKKARLESMNLLDNSLRNQVDYGPSAIELAIKQAGGEETWDEEEDNESQPNVDIEKEMNDVMSQAQSALVSTKNKPVPLDLDGITEEEDKENDSQTNIVDKNSIDKKSVGGGGGAGAGGGSGGSGGVAGGLTMKRSSSSPNISPVSSQKPRFFPKFNVDTIQTNFELQEESDIDSVVSEDEEQQKQLQNEENTTTQPESNTTTTETNPKPQQLPEEVVLATQEKESEVKDKTKKKKTTTTTKTKKKKELEKEKSKSKKGKKKSKKDADEEKENKKKSKNKKKGKDDDDDDDDDDEDDSETEETTRKKKKRDDKKSKSKKSKKKVDDDSEDDEDEEATTKKKRKSSKKKHTDEDDDDDDEDEEDTTTKKRKKKSTKKSGENEKNTTKNKRSSSSSKKSTKKDAKNKGPRVFDDNGDEVNEDDEEESPPKLYKQYREKTGEELDTFSDVDDDEIDHYIIKDENTIKAKYLLWHHYNKDYIQKQKEKEALRQQKGENSNPRRSRPKKVQPDSAAEAVLQALMPKVPKKSSLINWDAIGGDSLFKDLEQGKSLLDVDEEDESHQHHHNHGTDQYFSNQTATTSSSHIPSDDEEEDKVMEEEEEPNLDEDVVDNALMEIDMF